MEGTKKMQPAKEAKDLLDLLRNSSSLPNRQIVQEYEHIKRQLDQMKLHGADRQTLDRISSEAWQALQADLQEANLKEIERLNNEKLVLKSINEKNYLKNYEANKRSLEDASRRYASMLPEELDNEAINIMSNPLGENYDPRTLEELSVQLKYSASENFKPFRDYLKNENYQEPYLKTATGKEIVSDINFIKGSIDSLMVKTPEGRAAINFQDINDLIDLKIAGRLEE